MKLKLFWNQAKVTVVRSARFFVLSWARLLCLDASKKSHLSHAAAGAFGFLTFSQVFDDPER